jgi:DeoR family transcriptional regulator, aga operon transcriptional repressor
MTIYIEEAFLAKLNIRNSKKVIVLLDSSKFLHKSIISIAPFTDINTLIADSGISSDTLAEIKH